ncbi:10296_t:CDS:1, partial [Paraglomus occultum]
KFTRVPDTAIFDYFRNDLRGVAFLQEERFLQLTFHDEVSFQKHLSSSPITLNDKTVHLSPPRDFPRRTLVIHLHGLPILEKETIRTSIAETLSKYCNVKQIAPVVITNTNILTTKWDAIVEPITNKNIPVHLQILGCSIALTWANSGQICLRCHHTNHTHRNCPTKPINIRPIPTRTFAQAVQSSPQKDVNINVNKDPDTHPTNPIQTTHISSNPSHTNTSDTNTTSTPMKNPSGSNLVIIDETESI